MSRQRPVPDHELRRLAVGPLTRSYYIHFPPAYDGCPVEPITAPLPARAVDGTSVVRHAYGPGREGSEVVLYEIKGGGHTWPGRTSIFNTLGPSTRQIVANDLIWDFFKKHYR